MGSSSSRLSQEDHLRCEVIHGGFLKGRRHVNLPGVVQLPSITEKDKEDLLFAKEMDLDGIALFCAERRCGARSQGDRRNPGHEDYCQDREPGGCGKHGTVLEEADGIMVARGDLGLEVDMEELPQLQRRMAYLCEIHGKLIVATSTRIHD